MQVVKLGKHSIEMMGDVHCKYCNVKISTGEECVRRKIRRGGRTKTVYAHIPCEEMHRV